MSTRSALETRVARLENEQTGTDAAALLARIPSLEQLSTACNTTLQYTKDRAGTVCDSWNRVNCCLCSFFTIITSKPRSTGVPIAPAYLIAGSDPGVTSNHI